MPIRVSCQCGHSLSVPDQLAGKSGKCPKCQQVIKIPAAAPAQKAPAKSGPPASQPAPNSNAALAGLFDAAGLEQKKGRICPSCEAPVHPTAVICVKCGMNFQEGTQLTGYKSQEKRMFGDRRLNEAADMMAREAETESRLLNTGPPWWFMFAGLAGILVFIGGAGVKMDAATTGKKSSIEVINRVQSADMLTVLAASAGAACALIATFSNFAILITAFFESAKQGLLCMFAPLYILYYMFSRIRTHRLVGTVVLLWTTAILAGVLLGYSLPKI